MNIFFKSFLILLIIFSGLFYSVFFLAQSADATSYSPIVPCGRSGQAPCTQCDLLKLGKNIFDFILYFLVPVGGTILILVGGFIILFGGAYPEYIALGKSILKSTFYGIIIISTSWLMVTFLLRSLAGESNVADNWWQLDCEITTGHSSTNNGGGGTNTGMGTCQGSTCDDSSYKICGPVEANCSDKYVNNWDEQIRAAANGNQAGSGIDTIKLVKAIMANESSGNAKASSGADSFGLMQLQTSTANQFKTGCVSSGTYITESWLLDENNAKENICIAINYLRSLIRNCGANIRDIAAGYNGGIKACEPSVSCSSCSVCGGTSAATKKWECLWDGPDGEHKVCNADREISKGSSYKETRKYAPKVEYCFNKF